MISEATTPSRFGRKPLAALGKLALVALVAMGMVALLSGLILTGELDVFTLTPALIAFILAGLVATGWRWATVVAGVLSGLLLLALLAFTVPTLARPQEPDFISALLFLALALVATVAGIGAAVQNNRGDQRRAPRWLAYALIGLAGLVLGAILVALVPAQGTAAGVSPEVLAGLPMVKTQGFAFDQPVIRVKAGETVALQLSNEDSTAHSFDVDELGVHAPMPSDQPGLALFRPAEPGTYTFYCSIPGHANLEAGTGMVGTLIVEPAS